MTGILLSLPFKVISFFGVSLQSTVKLLPHSSSVSPHPSYPHNILLDLHIFPLLHCPDRLAISFKSVTFDVKWCGPERLQPLTHKNTHARGGLDVEGKVRLTLRGPNHPLSLSGLLAQSHLIESVYVREM